MTRETVLVTGVTGFIGSHVVEALLSQGSYFVLAIARGNRNDGKVEALKQKGVTVVEGEFFDSILIENVFREHSIRHVIHLAALRGAGKGSWGDYIKINVTGTEILLGAALGAGVKRFIYCSTVGVYGTIPAEVPATLLTGLCGDNAYHRSKILAENKVKEFVDKGLNALVLRPTITYGPGDDGFPKNLADLVRRRRLLLPQQNTVIHLLSVFSLSDLILKMLCRNNLRERVFIAADEKPILLRKLVDAIHQHYYKSSYPSYLTLPDCFFRGAAFAFRRLGNEKWSTRMLLISRNWCYQVSDTIRAFQFVPANTERMFLEYLAN